MIYQRQPVRHPTDLFTHKHFVFNLEDIFQPKTLARIKMKFSLILLITEKRLKRLIFSLKRSVWHAILNDISHYLRAGQCGKVYGFLISKHDSIKNACISNYSEL